MFEEETGIDVVYEEFETNEILYPKRSVQVLLPICDLLSYHIIHRMIENTLLAEIDFDTCPNIKNIGSHMAELGPGKTNILCLTVGEHSNPLQ